MMKNFGVQWLVEKDGYYWPPMALWTVELRPLDLAGAYTVFANWGNKKEITPILKIIDGKGNIIEDNTTKENKWVRVFDEGSSYLISSILSDTSSRPDSWNKFLTLSGRPVAAKTGTSTKQYKKANGEKVILPRNLWTIGYTPQYTTVVWVGNTDGSEVSLKWDWLQSAGPIWRDFMNFLHKGKQVEKWKMPSNIKSVNISEISWYLPPEGFPEGYSTGSLFKNIPRAYDTNFFIGKVDALCNGKVWDKTPSTAIKDLYTVNFNSAESEYQGGKWQSWINAWVKNGGCTSIFWEKSNYICLSETSKDICERSDDIPQIQVASNLANGAQLINGSNYIELAYSGKNPISNIEILLWENKIWEIPLDGKSEWSFKGSFFIPEGYYGDYNITLRAIDSQYYYWWETKSILITQKDSNAPSITLTNPIESQVILKKSEPFQIVGEVSDQSPIKSINIYMDGTPLKLWIQERKFTYTLNAQGNLPVWVKTITIE